ncbi:MAG: hypothetical protein HY819_18370 [Acidobacteria bacterium]|nr:hypothetical protein [Acidobacteriota bacterium]
MHLIMMMTFAFLVSIVFAGINSETVTEKARLFYGLKVFGSFMGIGLALAWVLYFFVM